MKIIKRTKGGSVHYVAALSPHGAIIGLIKDKEKALAVTDEQIEKMGRFYKGKAPVLVGEFSVEGDAQSPKPKPKAVVTPPPKAAITPPPVATLKTERVVPVPPPLPPVAPVPPAPLG